MSNTDKLEKLVESGSLTLRYSHKSEKKMTGAEWYARFEKELQGGIFPYAGRDEKTVIGAIEYVREAAKKASGIE